MAEQPFELRVMADPPDQYALALFQRRRPGEAAAENGHAGKNGHAGANGTDASWRLVVRVHGTPMKAVMDKVLATIKQAGYRPSDLSRARKAPFVLKEDAGVRLGLTLLSVKPLRKTTRMGDIAEHIQSMSEEEAYYWFSKTANARWGRRSQRALRILLAEE